MRFKKFFLFLLLAGLLACPLYIYEKSKRPSAPGPDQPLVETKDGILTVKLDARYFKAEVSYDPEARAIAEWARGGDEIVINGGFFDTDFWPSGFLAASGTRVGGKIFDQDKSGLVEIKNGAVAIRDLSLSPIQDNEVFESALQSYPFLIKNGQAAVYADSGQKARRSAIGLDKSGNVYLFVADLADYSLKEFADRLAALNPGIDTALNLDGGPSTGILINWGDRRDLIDSFSKVPSVIRFRKR